ncbi:MAG: hypothetical protein R2710_11400 [Acidimicrobiales bacterium]
MRKSTLVGAGSSVVEVGAIDEVVVVAGVAAEEESDSSEVAAENDPVGAAGSSTVDDELQAGASDRRAPGRTRWRSERSSAE